MASPTNISCKQKLRVGVTLPLSGPLSHNGEGFRNGVRLADEVFDSDDCVTFIFEDDQLKPQLTITAAHKLIGTDHIDGMISFGTPTSLAVAPLFERQHIPLVAVTVLKRVNAGYKSVLQHFPDTAEEAWQNSSLLRKRMVGCSSIFVKDVRLEARWPYPIA